LFTNPSPELYKAKRIIVDLRYNGGGSTDIGAQIFPYLTGDTILYSSKSISRLHIPTFKAWGKYVTPLDTLYSERQKKAWLSYHDRYFYSFDYAPDTVTLPRKPIVVPAVLLISHNTASAAEDFLIYADKEAYG